jgi:hypothetical protein
MEAEKRKQVKDPNLEPLSSHISRAKGFLSRRVGLETSIGQGRRTRRRRGFQRTGTSQTVREREGRAEQEKPFPFITRAFLHPALRSLLLFRGKSSHSRALLQFDYHPPNQITSAVGFAKSALRADRAESELERNMGVLRRAIQTRGGNLS